MDPISQINPVLDALRKQLAQNIERLRRAGRLAGSGRTAAAAGAAAAAEPLELSLRRRVSALDLRSPEGRATAVRAFVETVLVSEFGPALLTDPSFSDMLEEVSGSFKDDAELGERLAQALAAL